MGNGSLSLNFRLYTCITPVIRLRHIMECAMWPREMVSHDLMGNGSLSLNFRLYTCITPVIRLRHIMECAMWPREMVSHD